MGLAGDIYHKKPLGLQESVEELQLILLFLFLLHTVNAQINAPFKLAPPFWLELLNKHPAPPPPPNTPPCPPYQIYGIQYNDMYRH